MSQPKWGWRGSYMSHLWRSDILGTGCSPRLCTHLWLSFWTTRSRCTVPQPWAALKERSGARKDRNSSWQKRKGHVTFGGERPTAQREVLAINSPVSFPPSKSLTVVLASEVLCHYRRFSERLYFCLQCGRPGFDPWVRKIPWRRKWQPTPVFLPGESHGRRSLMGYSPRVTKSRTRLSDFTHFHSLSLYLFCLRFSELSESKNWGST